MPITVLCPNGHKITANEKYSGKTVACPKCKAAVAIPVMTQEAVAASVTAQPKAPTPTTFSVVCPNGHKLTASQKHLGKTIACPKCKAPTVIPAAAPQASQPRETASRPAGTSGPTAPAAAATPAQPTPVAPEEEVIIAESFSDPFADPLTNLEPLAADPLVPSGDPLAMDPLAAPSGSGDLGALGPADFGDLSTFEASAVAMPATPLKPQTAIAPPGMPPRPTAGREATAAPATVKSGRSPIHTLVAAIAGCALGLVIVIAFALWMFSGGNEAVAETTPANASTPPSAPTTSTPTTGSAATTPAGAQSSSAPTPGLVTNTTTDSGSPVPGSAAGKGAAGPASATAGSSPASATATSLAQPKTEMGLKQMDVARPAQFYELPFTTWGAVYDEASGRLALTHDYEGIVVYDLDEIMKQNVDPVGKRQIKGIPTALTYKPFHAQHLLVTATQSSPEVTIINLDDLEITNTIGINRARYIQELKCSANPEDPFIYYLTQRDGEEIDGKNENQRLGRINLDKGHAEAWMSHTQGNEIKAFAVTHRGDALYFSTKNEGQNPVWNREPIPESDPDPKPDFKTELVSVNFFAEGRLVTAPKGPSLAARTLLFGQQAWRSVAQLEFEPKAFFKDRPLIFGIAENALVLGSSNDYRTLKRVELPGNSVELKGVVPGFRQAEPYSALWPTTFLAMFSDDSRGLAIAVFHSRLVIVPLANLDLPAEEDLAVRNALPLKIKVGQETAVELDTKAKSPEISIVMEPDSKRNNKGWVQPFGVEPAVEVNTRLVAAVNATQDIILLSEVREIQAISTALGKPPMVMIGTETMKVTKIDEFRTAINVERNKGVAHSVTESFRILGGEDSQSAMAMPTVAGKVLKWTPDVTQVGIHSVKMRTVSGKVRHEWSWDVIVESPTFEIPFHVTGASITTDGKQAVVWGQLQPDPIQRGNTPPPPVQGQKFFLGMIDLAEHKLVKHQEIPHAIESAAMDQQHVYASLRKWVSEPPRSPMPTQIVQFSLSNLEIVKKVDVDSHCLVEIIAGKYLLANGWWSKLYRLSIPDMEFLEPKWFDHIGPSPGGIREDGWVWDGVLWDQEMKTARLLMFPYAFGFFGYQSIPLGGEFVAVTEPDSKYPGRFWAGAGRLDYYTYGSTQEKPTRSFTLTPHLYLDRSRDAMYAQTRPSAPVIVGGGQILVSSDGKLYSLPADKVISNKPPFRFDEKQSTFTLNDSGTTNLTYHCEGAVKYQLHLFLEQPNRVQSFTADPIVSLESTDGKFAVQLNMKEQFFGRAIQLLKQSRQMGTEKKPPREMLTNYHRAVTPAFRAITGRAPRGIAVPVYAVVIGHSENQLQVTGMIHSFLVELPAKEVEKVFEQ